jgi:hypothetical protein
MMASDQLATAGGSPQIDFARQMRDQEGDVKTAGKEPGVQQEIATIRHGLTNGPLQPALFMDVMNLPVNRPGQFADQRQGSQRHHGHCPHRPHPAHALDQLLEYRCKNELPERTAGIDHPGGRTTGFQRQTLRGGANQYRETPYPGTDGREQAQRNHQPETARHERCNRRTQRQNEQAADQHSACAVAIGHRPATGWMAPQVNCPMASARLMLAMPMPVVASIGPMNRPSDWREPIVTIMMPAAANVTIRTSGRLRERNMTISCNLLLW